MRLNDSTEVSLLHNNNNHYHVMNLQREPREVASRRVQVAHHRISSTQANNKKHSPQTTMAVCCRIDSISSPTRKVASCLCVMTSTQKSVRMTNTPFKTKLWFTAASRAPKQVTIVLTTIAIMLFASSVLASGQQINSNNNDNSDSDNSLKSSLASRPRAQLLVSDQQQPPQVERVCQLPPTWAGKWYQANKEPIRVTNTDISDKGLCRDQKGDKFLFEYTPTANTNGGKQQQQASGSCLVCLVINERHLNVLQYKESSCQQVPANYHNRSSMSNSNNLILDDDHTLLDSICSDITGDAQLESLFRLDTPAIECPITDQFSFAYDNCREPQSSLDSCIDKKQLNFKFSACPDVPGSESKSEVLKCYADWSEGHNHYMIGRLEHASNHQDKGKFRCFVYEKSADGKIIQMAQSLEESCYGLINANEGPKTLRLTAKPPTTYKCQFPSYIQAQADNWLSVDNSLIYMFNQNSTKYQVKETKEGNVIEEAACLQQYHYPQPYPPAAHLVHHHSRQHARSYQQQQPTSHQVINRRYQADATSTSTPQATSLPSIRTNEAVYLVQITKNCHTTNYCVRFYKRSSGIVQIDYFNASSQSSIDGPCRNAFVETPQTQIITSTNLERQPCPFEGAYTIEAPLESDLSYNPSNIFICPRQSFMIAQCDQPGLLRIHSKCTPQKYFIKNLYCLGRWTTNGLVRLLLDDDDRQRYSAWYKDYPVTPQVTSQDGSADSTGAAAITTRSQQLLAGSQQASAQQATSPGYFVDMQIALITSVKPMQVRLVKRSQCSELRGLVNRASSGIQSTTSMQRTASSAHSSIARSQLPGLAHYSHSSLLILIVTLLIIRTLYQPTSIL